MISLKGAVSDFAALLQVQRIRVLNDDRFYSSYILAANSANPQLAFVEIFPQNANGTSGSGGANRYPGILWLQQRKKSANSLQLPLRTRQISSCSYCRQIPRL
jgi:hypothetical protein